MRRWSSATGRARSAGRSGTTRSPGAGRRAAPAAEVRLRAAPCRSVLAGLGGLGIPVGDDFGPAAVGGTAVDESARRLDRSQVHGPALGFGSQHAGDL